VPQALTSFAFLILAKVWSLTEVLGEKEQGD
jgi:hypothetical protein